MTGHFFIHESTTTGDPTINSGYQDWIRMAFGCSCGLMGALEGWPAAAITKAFWELADAHVGRPVRRGDGNAQGS